MYRYSLVFCHYFFVKELLQKTFSGIVFSDSKKDTFRDDKKGLGGSCFERKR